MKASGICLLQVCNMMLCEVEVMQTLSALLLSACSSDDLQGMTAAACLAAMLCVCRAFDVLEQATAAATGSLRQ